MGKVVMFRSFDKDSETREDMTRTTCEGLGLPKESIERFKNMPCPLYTKSLPIEEPQEQYECYEFLNDTSGCTNCPKTALDYIAHAEEEVVARRVIKRYIDLGKIEKWMTTK